MSFNSLMALLVRSSLDHLEEKPTVLELGNQTLRANDKTLSAIIERSRLRDDVDAEGLRQLIAYGEKARGERAADYYKLLGFSDYTAIDVNDNYGSLIMDLNRDLQEAYDFRDTFSLVTNNGTGEHVFNQDAIYRNVHQHTKVGGLMLHAMPFYEFVNHGFFSIHPNLYSALAQANAYQLLSIGVATRNGTGIVAGDLANANGDTVLLKETRVPLSVVLSQAKGLRRGVIGRARSFIGNADGRRFGKLLRGLQYETPNLICFALMRKVNDGPFERPIQGIYEDVVAEDLKGDFAGIRA